MSSSKSGPAGIDPQRFQQYTPCDAADALSALGHVEGGQIPYVVQRSGPRQCFAGPAYTVEFAPKDDPRPAVPGHYIDSIPTGAIVLIATSPESRLDYAPFTSVRTALYGGLMSTRAKYSGARATVVLGQIRDIGEHQSLDYPVFSYDVGVCASNKTAKAVAVNEPLQLGTHIIHPGDIIVADENGVVAVPTKDAATALDYITRRTKADSLVAEDIRNGKLAGESQKLRRKGL